MAEAVQLIEVVTDVFVARDDPETVLRMMADLNVRIVTLTVTEKGYCHAPSTGRLNPGHPDIVHDIEARTVGTGISCQGAATTSRGWRGTVYGSEL